MDGKTIQELIDGYTSTNIYQQMKLYHDLYMKRNPNLMERIRQRELKRRTPNWCVPTAYFSTVIDTHAGYLFSNVQYDSKNDEYEAHLQEILDANNVSVKDMKAGLNALTFRARFGDKETEVRSLDGIIDPKTEIVVAYIENEKIFVNKR